uniref:Uncharacterized protein n=1 Tax=Timema poppense TaxID=170557 RepID=A0A7R9HAE3_TIMPO|nr:unnamed protein product [Timema poppensis]
MSGAGGEVVVGGEGGRRCWEEGWEGVGGEGISFLLTCISSWCRPTYKSSHLTMNARMKRSPKQATIVWHPDLPT